MRVQLSPWEVTEKTSFYLSPKRKRKSSRHTTATTTTATNGGAPAAAAGAGGSNSTRADLPPTMVARWVAVATQRHDSSHRPEKKARSSSSSSLSSSSLSALASTDRVIPSLIVTTDHRITILGRDITTNHALLCEIGQQQYASRPGPKRAFLHTSLPAIAAVLDESTSRIYAVQSGNHELISWSTNNGPGLDHATSIRLDSPVCSLSVLATGYRKTPPIVYGSCSNGTLYLARCEDKEEESNGTTSTTSSSSTWQVDYIPLEAAADLDNDESRRSDPARIVGTVAQCIPYNDERHTTGSKRKKSSRSSDNTSPVHTILVFYQLLHSQQPQQQQGNNTAQLLLLRRIQVSLFDDDTSRMDMASARVQTTPISLIAVDRHPINVVEQAEIVGWDELNHAMVISFRGSDKIRYYTTIALQSSGPLVGFCMPLPEDTSALVLLAPSILAVARRTNELMILDCRHTACLGRYALPMGVDEYDWTLVSDLTSNRLAVVFGKQDRLCVAVSSLLLDSTPQLLPSSRLSLAARLASSAADRPCRIAVEHFVRRKRFLRFDQSSESGDEHHLETQEQLVKSLTRLVETYDNICNAKADAFVPSYLLEAYERSIADLGLSGPAERHKSQANHWKDEVADNPQEAILSRQNGKVNGTHLPKPKPPNKVNGAVHSTPPHPVPNSYFDRPQKRGVTPKTVPQAFVNCAMAVIVGLLCRNSSSGGGSGSGGGGTPSKRKGPSTVSNDARLILRRLMRLGKVHARTNLPMGAGPTAPDSFDRFLQSIELQPREEEDGLKAAYNPVDLIVDMFRFCPDVSERQTVACLHYMLSSARPDGIAAVFTRNKHLWASDPFRALTDRLNPLQTKEHLLPHEQDEKDALSNKIILAGTRMVLERILASSECNQALLRRSLMEGIRRRQLGLLTRMLVNVLSTTAEVDSDVRQRAIQWIAVCSDVTRPPFTRYEVDNITRVRQAVANEIQRTNQILSLQAPLHAAAELSSSSLPWSEAGQVESDMKPTRTLPVPKAAVHLHAYQIERLVF